MLALAHAIKTPKPLNKKNESLNRSTLPKVHGEDDRIAIRDRFVAFIKDLWYLIYKPKDDSEESLMNKVQQHPDVDNEFHDALERIMKAFSQSVYCTIFCDWLCTPQENVLQHNFFNLGTTIQKKSSNESIVTEKLTFGRTLINATGKFLISNETKQERLCFLTITIIVKQ